MLGLRRKTILGVLAAILVVASCGGGAEEETGTSAIAVPDVFMGAERDVVKELFTIWEKAGHLGSLQQAADRAGVALSDSMRQSILAKMEANLMMHDQVARYRPYTFTLTNEEKRIANFIIRYEHANAEFPVLDSIAAAVAMEPQVVNERLSFLADLGMLFDLGGPDEYNDLGFSYGQKLVSFTYDLGTHVHGMQVGESPEINVGCSKEALFVIASDYPDVGATYRTYDPVSLEPITVSFADGQVVSTSPEGVLLFEGGTCGTNNLFVSRGNIEEFASRLPNWQGKQLPIYPVAERLEQVKQELEQGR